MNDPWTRASMVIDCGSGGWDRRGRAQGGNGDNCNRITIKDDLQNYNTNKESRKCDLWSMNHTKMIHILESLLRDFKITIVKMLKNMGKKEQ